MSESNGLICCPAFANVDTPLYLARDVPIVAPTLVAPVAIASSNLGTTAYIGVQGSSASEYQGAISFTTGENTNQSAPARDALTLVSETNGTLAYVGADDTNANTLAVNGSAGLSRVFDEVYNPAVSLKAITLSSTNPLCVPAPGNVGEIFRCSQAGVLASATAAIGTAFEVPKTGWYALQIEVKLANGLVPDINVPITVAPGGVNLGEQLSFNIVQGVVVEPYGLMEITSNEFAVSEVLSANSLIVRVYSSLHLLDSTETYTFNLRSSSAVWNIGSGGQLKAELIAMC